MNILALAVLGMANASQAYGNFFRSRPGGRWNMGRGWDRNYRFGCEVYGVGWVGGVGAGFEVLNATWNWCVRVIQVA